MAMGKSRRVLVVDDDDGMREAIDSLLVAAGFETLSFSSAEALLADATTEGACCVISDLMLPAMSGLQLMAELRTRGAGPPVILITAHDTPNVRDDVARSGAAAYLAKPFSGSALLAAIERIAGSAVSS